LAGAIIYGFHAVRAKLRAAAGAIEEIYLDAKRQDARAHDLAQLAAAKGVRVMLVDAARIDGLARAGRHQGVAASVKADAHAPRSLEDVLDGLDEPALVLVLDGVTDPHNLGACLRVADGAGAHAVIAPKDRACGLNATVAKVASGAAETVPYFMVGNLARTLDELKERGIWIVGATEDATDDLFGAELPEAAAWVLGAEGPGLRRLTREKCDFRIRIPMFGALESLNVAVAAGVCLYEARRRRARRR
jgi:23S rRNA (guanosine2251-2'-O)-methyltransferase